MKQFVECGGLALAGADRFVECGGLALTGTDEFAEGRHGFGMAAFVRLTLLIEDDGALLVGANHGADPVPNAGGGVGGGDDEANDLRVSHRAGSSPGIVACERGSARALTIIPACQRPAESGLGTGESALGASKAALIIAIPDIRRGGNHARR